MKPTKSQRRPVVHLLSPVRPDPLLPGNIIAFTLTEEAAAEVKERNVTRTRQDVLPLRRGHRGRCGGSASAGPGA